MDFSIVISTRNRADRLPRCLAAIGRLSSGNGFELVVVDNNSTDDTRAIVELFARTVPFPVAYVLERRPGLSFARNAGIARSRGRIIVFTDDDCYPREDLLDHVDAAFRDQRIGFMSGRVLLFDRSDYPAMISEWTERRVLEPGTYIWPGLIKGANMAYRRSVLDRIGGFDPVFGSGTPFPCDDCDAAARASLAGFAGLYTPDAVVYHHHGRKAHTIEKSFREYDTARGAYHVKLLLTKGGTVHGIRGFLGLHRRIRTRPSSLFWELLGAVRYCSRHRVRSGQAIAR
jgi:glycosyltransferase involved in cell wall biosynthesis